jgi:hypothetical protein
MLLSKKARVVRKSKNVSMSSGEVTADSFMEVCNGKTGISVFLSWTVLSILGGNGGYVFFESTGLLSSLSDRFDFFFFRKKEDHDFLCVTFFCSVFRVLAGLDCTLAMLLFSEDGKDEERGRTDCVILELGP